MATEAWRIEHFMFMFMDGGSAVLWGEVECPLHSSEQIATRAAEHGGGGENYTDGRRTDRPLSLKNEATQRVCLSGTLDWREHGRGRAP